MINPQAAVFARMTGDATLVALLLSFSGAPGVFEDGKAPDAARTALSSLPMIVVTPPSHQLDDDTFDADFRAEQISLRLYHRHAGSSLPLLTAAERVRALFKDWGPTVITGGTVINTTVSGPFPAPTDDPSLDGRMLTLTLLIKEI